MRHPTLLDHNRFHPLERKEVEVHDPKASVFFFGGDGREQRSFRLWGVCSKGRWTKMKQKKVGVWVDLMLRHDVGYKKGMPKRSGILLLSDHV